METFLPPLRAWFKRRFGDPTEIQRLAWPAIERGESILALAPTGSGKTLAAFLSFINAFASQRLTSGRTRLLYISPLRALNNDMHRNLLVPLEELRREFERDGYLFPQIRVQTRSGDTGQRERRQMLLHPPEILITTPESLNLLLSSGAASRMLGGLKAVILDEIHALADVRRGVHLMTAVERLVDIAGEFQRVGLSASVANPVTIAAYLGGFSDSSSDVLRTVRILHVSDSASFSLDIVPVPVMQAHSNDEGTQPEASPHGTEAEIRTDERTLFFDALAAQIDGLLSGGRRVLCFTESRRMTEKLALLLNERHEEAVAFAHHGSLSRELRLSIEERFKAGRLPCVVATSSLELGIDIGDLDEVVLLQCPGSSSRALQRLGRAGHRPGELSRGTAIPLHDLDLMRMVVLRRMVERQELEPLIPLQNPLDVLAQVLVSMACEAESAGHAMEPDHALSILKRTYAYHDLDLRHFRLVLSMLEGRFQGLSQSGLRARLRLTAAGYTVVPGARMQLYQSGGTIGERGQFSVRTASRTEGPSHGARGALLGEFDEEFVFERKVGDRVVLGSRLWQITAIGDSDVEVVQAGDGWGMNPFWRADGRDMDNSLADRLAETMERWSLQMEEPQERALIAQDDPPGSPGRERAGAIETAGAMDQQDFMGGLAAEEGERTALALMDLFRRQRESTGMGLPHRHRIIAECPISEAGAGGYPIYYHTFWGGRRNRPFAIALLSVMERELGVRISHYVSDEGLLLILPGPFGREDPARFLSLVTPDNLLEEIERALPESTLFGSAFRQAAGISLLLPSRGFGRRTPFWLHRMAASRLLEGLSGKGEFPVTIEAWRSLLRDRFDLAGLRQRIEEIHSGEIQIVRCDVVNPGPLTSGLEYQRTGDVMYRPDGRGDAGHNTAFFSDLAGIPAVPEEIILQFEDRSLRRVDGYRPETEEETIEWLIERGFLPLSEWRQLRGDAREDEGASRQTLRVDVADEPLVASVDGAALLLLCFPGAGIVGGAWSREDLISRATELQDREGAVPSITDILERFLSWYGPFPVDRLLQLFGENGMDAFEELTAAGVVLRGQLVRGHATEHVCHRTNLERLHRMARRASRSAPPVRPAGDLALFLAEFQGLTQRQGRGADRLRHHFERLFGFVAPAALWEADILPARMCEYRTADLDALMSESALAWTGAGQVDSIADRPPGRGPSSSTSPVYFFLIHEAVLFTPMPSGPSSGQESTGPDDERLERLFSDATPGTFPERPTTENQGWLLHQLRAGRLASLSAAMFRRSVRSRFRPPVREPQLRQPGRWGRGSEVSLFLRMTAHAAEDSAEEEERRRERCRLLLDRYGILFRDLLVRELPSLQWRQLYRTLCRMELAGEVIGGQFFSGLSGLQFLRPAALHILSQGLPDDAVYWMNAKDPASLCGVPGFALPARQAGTRLVYRGAALMAAFLKSGRALWFYAVPEACAGVEAVFNEIMERDFDPPVRWIIETINGEWASTSAYGPVLEKAGFRSDGRRLVRYRTMQPAPMP